LVCDLTERIVEDYYLARGFDVPEYSFILHDRQTAPGDGSPSMQQLHTHVILPGTAPLGLTDRGSIYNNASKGHDILFREIATQHFEHALDETIGTDWRQYRTPEREPPSLEG
jgi:hypothetical protein